MKFIKYTLTVILLSITMAATGKGSFTMSYADHYMKENPEAVGIKGVVKKSWAYDNAMMARVYLDLFEATGNQKYFEYMRAFTDFYMDSDGNITGYDIEEFNLDRIQPARSLILLHQKTGDERYFKAMFPFVEQLKRHPRNDDGGFWHKHIYTNQMWLDGLYMACPFMVMYAHYYDQPEWYDQAILQLRLAYKHTRDPKTGLLYHAWDQSRSMYWCEKSTGLSHHVWGRAVGWYMMALVDVLDYLPESHPGHVELTAILKELSSAVVENADKKTGLWYQVMEYPGREGNYLEGSGSAMFAYTFLKGAKQGYLDKTYYNIGKKSYDSIKKHLFTIGDGKIVFENICGGAGLGGREKRDGSYSYYVNERITPNDPKGAAPFILAGLIIEGF